MIFFLTICYILLLFILIKLGLVANKLTTWLTVIPYKLILLLFLFIPMQWGSPAGDLHVATFSVTITPNVAGTVIEVPVKANTPLKKGDILFKIDPVPYQAAYDALKAELALSRIRLQESQQLLKNEAGTLYDVQQYTAEVEKLQAQIKNAKWNLDSTIIRAPSDGYVTFVGLRPGQRVGTFPGNRNMAFIDTSETILGSQVAQNFSKYIKPGQAAEVTFKSRPGKVYPARVIYMIPATAQGQILASGSAVTPQSSTAMPFMVRLKLDDPDIAGDLVVGTVGSSAIYTSHVKVTHIIRKVMLRMTAILNYINLP